MNKDILLAKQKVYDRCGTGCGSPEAEKESAEYAACSFIWNGRKVRYREAKITPAKTGLFVTTWKRGSNGQTEPLHSTDLDLLIISTRDKERFGQFIFPRSVLLEKGVISGGRHPGKRGIRVYPPWSEVTSKQAERTKLWQAPYFLFIPEDGPADLDKAKKLSSDQ